jgi:hypothetical protein
MRSSLLLLLSIPLLAQTYSAVSVTDISHSAATIKWTTSVATGSYIKYGTTVAYGSVSEASHSYTTAHEWFISGLNANTLYNYQLCSTSGSCDATNRTLTTSALPSPHPAMPTLPTSTPVLPAMPTVWGTTATITDCSTLQTAINNAAAADGNANHLISITKTLDCSFNIDYSKGSGGPAAINFPAKSGANSSGTGQIVITTTGTLPPEGSRITSDYYSEMPIWRVGPFVPERSGPQSTGTCIAGQKYWSFITSGWSLFECTVPASNTYALTAKTDFSGAIPLSCAVNNSWYYKTDATDPTSLYWCGNNKLYAINTGNTPAGGAIGFSASAHHYRISGIRFLATPTASGGIPASWAEYAYNFNFTYGVFDWYTNSGINNIYLDRIQVDVSYPYRLRWTAITTGTGIILANSNIASDYHVPTLGDSSGCDACTTSLIQLSGADNVLIDNNYVDSTGITVFATDDDPKMASTDVTVKRNYFVNGNKHMSGTAANTAYCGGCFFPSRHQLEIKMGSRWLIDGNYWDSHFTSTNNQADLWALSTRPSVNLVPISDVWFRNNKAWSIPNLAYVLGHNDQPEQAAATTRTAFTNNLVWDIDGLRYPTGGTVREGRGWRIFSGAEDTIITGNTVLNACTGYAPYLALSDFGPSEGLELWNNISTGCLVPSPFAYLGRINVAGGTTGLNAGWPSTAGYSVTNNATYDGGGGLTGTGYPSGNLWPASLAAVQFADTTTLDYRLKFSSTYAPNGVGADVDAIRAAYGEVYNLRALSITSSGATVYYTAPDATTACTVEYGTSATAGTGTRVTDSTGSRFRTKALTGLASGTAYSFRVYCSQMAAGTFTTN